MNGVKYNEINCLKGRSLGLWNNWRLRDMRLGGTMVGALAFTALTLGILKDGTLGLAPEFDPCEEEDPEELPPLIFFFFWSCLYWFGYMCLGSVTILY